MKPEKANLKRSCMHLTNYAVNKNNTKFEFNSSSTETDKGSKWTLSSLFKALAAKGYDIGRLKRQMRKMVVMTIISIVPHLIHNYRNCLNEDDNGRSCFELLGMDVLLDEKCRPWLLEVCSLILLAIFASCHIFEYNLYVVKLIKHVISILKKNHLPSGFLI